MSELPRRNAISTSRTAAHPSKPRSQITGFRSKERSAAANSLRMQAASDRLCFQQALSHAACGCNTRVPGFPSNQVWRLWSRACRVGFVFACLISFGGGWVSLVTNRARIGERSVWSCQSHNPSKQIFVHERETDLRAHSAHVEIELRIKGDTLQASQMRLPRSSLSAGSAS